MLAIIIGAMAGYLAAGSLCAAYLYWCLARPVRDEIPPGSHLPINPSLRRSFVLSGLLAWPMWLMMFLGLAYFVWQVGDVAERYQKERREEE